MSVDHQAVIRALVEVGRVIAKSRPGSGMIRQHAHTPTRRASVPGQVHRRAAALYVLVLSVGISSVAVSVHKLQPIFRL